jgi:ribulose-5-phosphate 4-epimerase/fuculose-1-phosphate aldolase
VHQNALRFQGRCAYDEDFNGLAADTEEGDRMARVMGDKSVLFLGNHGVVVVGATVAEAYDDLYYLERACQIQVMAMMTGRTPRLIADDIARETAQQFRTKPQNAELHFTALKAMLDSEEPQYAS